jgi:hypothetical protein
MFDQPTLKNDVVSATFFLLGKEKVLLLMTMTKHFLSFSLRVTIEAFPMTKIKPKSPPSEEMILWLCKHACKVF